MEEAWKEFKLGDVCSRLRSGKGIKAESVLDVGLFPVIGGNGIRGYTNVSNFKGECAIIGRQGAYCGNVRFYEGEAYMTEHAVVVVGNELADTRYLACLLSLMHLGNLSAQSAQPGLSVQTLSKLLIPLPSIEYQRRVSSIIQSLDDKIECNRRINDNLLKHARALYKSWFIDFEPFKGDKFEDSELGMIPRGWSVKQLGEITTQVNEKVKERVDVKVLSPITTGELVLSEEYFTKQVFSESISKYIVVKPTYFAYNPARVNIGSLGMNEYGFDGCVSPVYVVFRCEDDYQYFFDLFRRTETFKEEVKARAIGGVRQSLTYKDFSLIKVVYPPIDVIRGFNQVYLRILAKTRHNIVETARLASLRDTLLPKLISGELKIS